MTATLPKMALPIKIQPGAVPPPPPGAVEWMAVPAAIPDCPPGLEYLSTVDEIYVKQELCTLEAFTSWESKNHYSILNKNSQKIYDASEESNLCFRQCCKSNRAYTMHVMDNFHKEVIRIKRPFRCFATGPKCACLPCCAHVSTVESPPGKKIGSIRQRCACCSSCFYVRDENGDEIFSIEGPCSCCIDTMPCCGKVFTITTVRGGHEIGEVVRKWNGYANEYYTNTDLFGVKFPKDLDVKMKAVLMGAVFLIDFMEFEKPPKKDPKKQAWKETEKMS